jgi:hypothetical protein
MAKVRSAKGEIVDFDLLKMKQKMVAPTETIDVNKRRNLIEQRLRRKIKQVPAPAPAIPQAAENKVDEPIEEVKLEETEEKQTSSGTRQKRQK